MSELTKVCNKCGTEKPATADYFNKAKTGKYGLKGDCRVCQAQYLKKHHEANLEKHKANGKRYQEENKERISQVYKQYYKANKERIAQYKKQYSEANKEKIVQHRKVYYASSKERFAERGKLYREANRDKTIQYSRQYHKENQELYAQYREQNKEKYSEKSKLWKQSNLDRCATLEQKRRAIKANLPSDFTLEQWEECKNRFNNFCAYCGKEKKLAQDHFIALSEGGSYTSENIVPSCQRCNSSKNNRAFSEWYPKQKYYSKKREQAIMLYLNQNYIGEQIGLPIEESVERFTGD